MRVSRFAGVLDAAGVDLTPRYSVLQPRPKGGAWAPPASPRASSASTGSVGRRPPGHAPGGASAAVPTCMTPSAPGKHATPPGPSPKLGHAQRPPVSIGAASGGAGRTAGGDSGVLRPHACALCVSICWCWDASSERGGPGLADLHLGVVVFNMCRCDKTGFLLS